MGRRTEERRNLCKRNVDRIERKSKVNGKIECISQAKYTLTREGELLNSEKSKKWE